jgi:hypothetical protein
LPRESIGWLSSVGFSNRSFLFTGPKFAILAVGLLAFASPSLVCFTNSLALKVTLTFGSAFCCILTSGHCFRSLVVDIHYVDRDQVHSNAVTSVGGYLLVSFVIAQFIIRSSFAQGKLSQARSSACRFGS